MTSVNQPFLPSVEPVSARTPHSPSPSGQSGNLYIADDNAEFAAFVTRVASREGWGTTSCKNGLELIEELEANQGPAIVFVDLMMPEMDGIEVIKRLAKMNANLHVRFVTGGAMSNVDAAEKIAHGYGLSVGPSLLKPLTMDELKVELLKELVSFEKMKMEHCEQQ